MLNITRSNSPGHVIDGGIGGTTLLVNWINAQIAQ
jgi:hypothetical protein